MTMILRASMLTTFALFFIVQTRADAQTPPNDTAAFVSFCNAANFQVCRGKVVDINNIMLIKQIGGNHGCTIPHPNKGAEGMRADSAVATKAILDWLIANKGSRPPEADLAIAQAIAELWPQNCEH
jgi:hypothetical protein